MATKKMFAEKVAGEIRDYLPPKYRDAECKVIEQRKNNGAVYVGVYVSLPGQDICPIVYIEPYYEAVREGKPFGEAMDKIARITEQAMAVKNIPGSSEIQEYEKAKEKLSVILVNTRANRQTLREMPHREIEDLSLIFDLRFSMSDERGRGSIKIDHTMLKKWGISEETLYQDAMKNVGEKGGPILQSLETAAEEALGIREGGENLLESGEPKVLPETLCYTLTNPEKYYGAAAILYPGVMEKASALFPDGFYLLPSSIHEMLILPKNGMAEPQALGEMVREVNRTGVEKEDILSDRIYEYDKEAGKIRQVPESLKRGREMER